MVTLRKRKERKERATNLGRAREMRRSPVVNEKSFWLEVRDRKLGGFKFRRQVLIGPYIADFVCVEKRLIVELDGPFHDENYDAARDRFLRAQGYRILRFRNEELSDFVSVLLAVKDALETTTPSP